MALRIDHKLYSPFMICFLCTLPNIRKINYYLFLQAKVSSTFAPSLKDGTTEHYPSISKPVVTHNQGQEFGRWKRKKLVRKTLKKNRNDEIKRRKRSPPSRNENLDFPNSKEVLVANMKRNYNDNIPTESEDRAAVWNIHEAFKG